MNRTMADKVQEWIDSIFNDAKDKGVVCSCCGDPYLIDMGPHAGAGTLTREQFDAAVDLYRHGGRFVVHGGRGHGKSAFQQAMKDFVLYGQGEVRVVR